MHEISIIVPCYNQAKYLDVALQSVLSQTYSNWKCIIINDGSTDNTSLIAEKWIEKDNRFIYFEKVNGGLSSARNLGLANAKGDYIQFLDSDDYLADDKFILSVESFLKDCSLDVVITDYNMVSDLDSKNISSYCKLSNINFNFENIVNNWDIDFTIPIHCAVFKRSSIGDLRFNENLRAKEDWLFWVQFFKKSYNFKFIHQQLVSYRRHSNSMTQSANYMNESRDQIINFIKQELTIEEYEIFLLKRVKHYMEKSFENSLKYTRIKNSLSYRFAMKMKLILFKMGLLLSIKTVLKKL